MDKVFGGVLRPGDYIRFRPFDGSVYILEEVGSSLRAMLWCLHEGDRAFQGTHILPGEELFLLNPSEVDTHRVHLAKRKEAQL